LRPRLLHNTIRVAFPAFVGPQISISVSSLAQVFTAFLEGTAVFGELIPCGGGEAIPLLRTKLVFGRQSHCDVTLPFPSVSSRHCELELKDGYWFVRDLESTNGTRVQEKRCTSDWLMPGDEISIANYRYTICYSPPPDLPPPKESSAELHAARSLDDSAALSDDQTSIASRVEWSTNLSLGELVPVGGGAPIMLLKANLVLGRHDSCDVPIPNPTVSATHCELSFIGGYWRVRDLGSRNGTRVDGQLCESEWLMPGNVLGLAKARYLLNYTATSDEPPPEQGEPSVSPQLTD
jgi:pSer/pThr/pTyr-binding forkhead associated (FHA) protein